MSGRFRNVIVCSLTLIGPATENWNGGGNDIVTAPVISAARFPVSIEPASVSSPLESSDGASVGELAATVPTVQVAPLKHGASTLLVLTPLGLPNSKPLVADSPDGFGCVSVIATSDPSSACGTRVTVAAIFGA